MKGQSELKFSRGDREVLFEGSYLSERQDEKAMVGCVGVVVEDKR